MAKYEWSEVFISVEGEAQFVGHPTVYIRFARCNFKCPMFNNPNHEKEDSGYAPLSYEPSDATDILELEPNTIGCDSQYAVNPAFKHIWYSGTEDDLSAAVINLLPNNEWIHKGTGTSPILSLTGGEPTIRIKHWGSLLFHKSFQQVEHLLIETNCAVPLKLTDIKMLSDWLDHGREFGIKRIITWSNSPKLSNSGEDWNKAINPTIALHQRNVAAWTDNGTVNQYFKFVCDDSDKSFDEVAKAMSEYHAGGIPEDVPVYIMPESCITKQQDVIAKSVALKCIDRGYIFCYRVHMPLFANAIGT